MSHHPNQRTDAISLSDLMLRLEGATYGELDELSAEVARFLGTFSLTEQRWPTYSLYCASVDAAMMLVPKGARIRELGQWWDIDRPAGWFCNVMRWERDETLALIERSYAYGFTENDTKMPRTALTPAIAVCIAALKCQHAIS